MRKDTGVYAYLEANRLLDKGPEAIKAGKIAYRKEYLKLHKTQYRKRIKGHTISLKPIEEKSISLLAKAHGMKVAEYLRQSSLAYSNKQYLVPRIEAIHQIQQSIVYLRTQIQRIGDERPRLFTLSKEERIEKLLLTLEDEVKTALHTPRDLENEIITTLKTRPGFIEVLKKITDDYQVSWSQKS